MPTEDVKTPLATDKTLKQLIDVVKNISLKSDIYNGLDSESSTRALSALQGKILNDNKFDKTNVYNGLDKTVSGFALDARQGKALNDSINAIMKHTLGSPVSVSSTYYTTESDGYFVGDSGDSGANNYCNLMTYDSITLMSCVSTEDFGHIRGAVYIKKGMVIFSQKNNSNAFSNFYPLV